MLAALLVGVLPSAAAGGGTALRGGVGAATIDAARTTGVSALRGAVARAGLPARAAAPAARSGPGAAQRADRAARAALAEALLSGGSAPGDLGLLPLVPVLAPPLLLVQRPRPPTGAPSSSLPAGPTGRSPPAAAAV